MSLNYFKASKLYVSAFPVGKRSHCTHWNIWFETISIAVMTMIWPKRWSSLILTNCSCFPVQKYRAIIWKLKIHLLLQAYDHCTTCQSTKHTYTPLPFGDFLHHLDRHTCCVNTIFLAHFLWILESQCNSIRGLEKEKRSKVLFSQKYKSLDSDGFNMVHHHKFTGKIN